MGTEIYKPFFTRTAKLVRYLTEASKLESWVRQQTIDVSWIPKSQRDAFVRLAHYSTRIEGNPLTLPEVEALASGKDLAVEEGAKREVLNYFAALRWIWKKSPYKICEKALLDLHRILTDGLLPEEEIGCYKTKPNAVFGDGRLIYKPPPPEIADILTNALIDWINSKENRDEHPVVMAAIAHHRLVSIHPFMDGNGRIARCLETWLMYRRGFDTQHVFALDEFFYVDRERYYREIQKVRENDNNITSWLEYIGEGILATLKKTQARIQVLRTRKTSIKMILTASQERVLQILVESPSMGGGDLMRALKITRSGLQKILKPLLTAGLITKEGSTKSAAYRLN